MASRGGFAHPSAATLTAGGATGLQAAPWRPGRLWERKSSGRPSSGSAWLEGAAGWDTHTQMATRQTVGLGFQATLFTTPPTGRVFMQRAVHTSQNRTVPSSEPAGQDGVGWGQDSGAATARLGPTPEAGEQPHAPPAPPLLAAFGEELWEQQEGGSNALAPASPQQLLRTTAAPAPQRRDVTGGCCRENRRPSRSLPPHGAARGPPPDARSSGRSCRAGSAPGSARRGVARRGPVSL